jgi:hypothetical protein
MGWKSWHAGIFRQDGIYVLQLLIFYKTPNYCLSALSAAQRENPDFIAACNEARYKSELLVVDTRKDTVETVKNSHFSLSCMLNVLFLY